MGLREMQREAAGIVAGLLSWHDAPYRTRQELLETPELFLAVIEKLLEDYPKRKDEKRYIDVVEDFLLHFRMESPLVLRVVKMFGETRPELVKCVLFFNVHKALSYHLEHFSHYLESYLQEYLNRDLPLNILKAVFLAELSREYQTELGCKLYLLWMFRPHKGESDEIRQKKEEVFLFLAEHVFDRIRAVQQTSWVNYSFHDLLHGFPLSPSSIRAVVSWALRPWVISDGKYHADYTINMLRIYVRHSSKRLKLVEEAFLLEDEYMKLRGVTTSRVGGRLSRFVENSQNVHAVRIEDDVMEEIEKTLGKFSVDETSEKDLLEFRENPKVKTALERVESDETIFYGRTLKQWFLLIYRWCVKEGHTEILRQELEDMSGKCVSGHFRRLINVMNGIAVDLKLSDHEKIKKEYFDRTNQRISEQPDSGEILCDISLNARPFANEIAREMLRENSTEERFEGVMEARMKYLRGE